MPGIPNSESLCDRRYWQTMLSRSAKMDDPLVALVYSIIAFGWMWACGIKPNRPTFPLTQKWWANLNRMHLTSALFGRCNLKYGIRKENHRQA